VLNQRAMEVFSDVGVAEAIYARSTPGAHMSHTAWYLDVAGDQDAGRLIHKMESWDGGYTDPAWIAASPYRQANLPQIRLEPILRARAEHLNSGRVRFGHELLSLQQDARGVTAMVRDLEGGTDYEVRADYLLGCDGGRTVGRLVGSGRRARLSARHPAGVTPAARLGRARGDPRSAPPGRTASRLVRGGPGRRSPAGHRARRHPGETHRGGMARPRLAFLRVREFGREGAILVRPDRVVAWRSMGAAADPGRELGAAIDRILARAA
jgi:2-polyprenyl-6-methoxyphenol hydroxylase-like FAD-dependent oxidoreductase